MANFTLSKLGILISLFISTASVTAADWTPLSSNSDGDDFLIDRSSIRSNGGILQAWTMVNLGTQKPDGTRSQKTAFLLNCHTWEWAVRSGVNYSAPDGQGQLLNSTTARPSEINYQPAIPDSVTDAILVFACKDSK